MQACSKLWGVGISVSGTSGRSLAVLLRNRLEAFFSFSWMSSKGPRDVKEDLDDGRDEERLVKTDEHVDDRHVVAALWLQRSMSSSASPMINYLVRN